MQGTDQEKQKKNRKRKKGIARLLRSLRNEVFLDERLYKVKKPFLLGSIPEDYFQVKRIT